MTIEAIDVIGAGAWGTALAALARENRCRVRIWAHEPEVAAAINEEHENPHYLAGVELPDGIEATSELSTLGDADAALLVTPAQHLRAVARRFAAHVGPEVPVVICAKGIEQETGRLMSEVCADVLPDQALAVLSGPTFAAEVARGRPTAVTIAAADQALADELAAALGSARFRPYASHDLIGAEVGGALKNVIAVACGIAEGLDFGQNARAALITRGLAEITRFAVAKGAEPATLAGLSGLGDLVLTATSEQSRNYSLGLAVGRGARAKDVLAERRTVAEGAYTAGAVARLAGELDIDMPIAASVDRIINRDADMREVVEELLARPFRREEPA
ncbi:MAG TPA: NAD(P)H-dependent glycerol-3-phosphate dehydrogenase [Alphaproteobacteria bacterium]|nr:NAD(P)H-dependent glycerol-3-phosphate dehydrogenase [Alphaproteobacteria bacterium]